MKNVENTFDVIVIGSGFAGLAAAIEARERRVTPDLRLAEDGEPWSKEQLEALGE